MGSAPSKHTEHTEHTDTDGGGVGAARPRLRRTVVVMANGVGAPARTAGGRLGLELRQTTHGRATIGALVPGGAAERAGARPGDVVLSIDGASVRSLSPGQVADLLDQTSGAAVELDVEAHALPQPSYTRAAAATAARAARHARGAAADVARSWRGIKDRLMAGECAECRASLHLLLDANARATCSCCQRVTCAPCSTVYPPPPRRPAASGGTAAADDEAAGLGADAAVALASKPLCITCQKDFGMWGEPPPLAPPAATARRRKNVLCLDGGGLKGAATLHILAAIERATGKPTRELFDLIVGCSAGGLIALKLGCFGTASACEEGLDLCRRMGEQAFVPQFSSTLLGATVGAQPRVTTHKYRHRVLERLFMQELGWETRMQMGSPRVAAVAVEWAPGPRRAVLFRSYPQPAGDGVLPGVTGARLWDAARCTTAAPTYFKPHTVGGAAYVDGGVAGNDPSLAGLSEAVALWGADNIGVFVSVGSCPKPPPPQGGAGAGAGVGPGPGPGGEAGRQGWEGGGGGQGGRTPWLWDVVREVVDFSIHNRMPETSMAASTLRLCFPAQPRRRRRRPAARLARSRPASRALLHTAGDFAFKARLAVFAFFLILVWAPARTPTHPPRPHGSACLSMLARRRLCWGRTGSSGSTRPSGGATWPTPATSRGGRPTPWRTSTARTRRRPLPSWRPASLAATATATPPCLDAAGAGKHAAEIFSNPIFICSLTMPFLFVRVQQYVSGLFLFIFVDCVIKS